MDELYRAPLWQFNADSAYLEPRNSKVVLAPDGVSGDPSDVDKSLDLYANNGTLGGFRDDGHINVHNEILFNETFTLLRQNTGLFNQVEFYNFANTSTITIQSGTNIADIAMTKNLSTIQFVNSLVLSSAPTHDDRVIIQPTASVNIGSNSAFESFRSFISWQPSLSTGVSATVDNVSSYNASPFVSMAAGSHASATSVVTNLTGYSAFLRNISSQATVTNARGIYIKDMSNSGTVTNQAGVVIEGQTQGTNTVGLLLGTATIPSGDHAIYSSSTNSSYLAGALEVAGDLTTGSGRIKNTTRYTTTQTIPVTDEVVFGNTDSAGWTATLPAGAEGQTLRIINSGSSGNNLTVAPNGAEHLYGVNSNFVLADGESIEITYNATDGWY